MVSIILLINIVVAFAVFSADEGSYTQKATFQNMSQCEQAQVDDQICVPKTDNTAGLFDKSQEYRNTCQAFSLYTGRVVLKLGGTESHIQ